MRRGGSPSQVTKKMSNFVWQSVARYREAAEAYLDLSIGKAAWAEIGITKSICLSSVAAYRQPQGFCLGPPTAAYLSVKFDGALVSKNGFRVQGGQLVHV